MIKYTREYMSYLQKYILESIVAYVGNTCV